MPGKILNNAPPHGSKEKNVITFPTAKKNWLAECTSSEAFMKYPFAAKKTNVGIAIIPNNPIAAEG